MDFEAIATALAAGQTPETIRELLTAVWNARGAADATAVSLSLNQTMGMRSGEVYSDHCRRAILAVDRT